jgi:reactive intermediate/imine deaminase
MHRAKNIVVAIAVLTSCATTTTAKRAIEPPEFPPGRPFTPGVLAGDTLYLSGQIGSDLKTDEFPEDFDAEARICFEKIGIVLRAAGMDFRDAVSVQVFLTDMTLFQRMNAVYRTYFKDPPPARTTTGATKLAGKARIEVTVIAKKPM